MVVTNVGENNLQEVENSSSEAVFDFFESQPTTIPSRLIEADNQFENINLGVSKTTEIQETVYNNVGYNLTGSQGYSATTKL